VLGAATYNFTRALSVGVRSDEVTELQKVLIAEGLLKIDAPTGYFGSLTRAAVIAFQKSRGIAQAGVVGPLTRAELNKGRVVSEVAKTNLTTSQADAILSTLASFGADAEVVARVRASLGR
jgi:peptidoglycan hydrolase-like protein with peptidoglycan-binding domain